MQKGFSLILWLLFLSTTAIAKNNPPLKIAVTHFMPPFVMQNSNRDLAGFDIDLMLHICKDLDRKCEFIPMRSSQVLPAVALKKVDVGLGGIDIGKGRYTNISYSDPYMLSEYRLLTNKYSESDSLNSASDLKDKRIGVQNNSLAKAAFLQFAKSNDISLKEYKDTNKLITALLKNKIDIAVVHNATAAYWQNNSANQLKIIGNPLNIGLGIGIPVYSKNSELIRNINRSISSYKNSNEYKQLYMIYFGSFS